MGATVHKVLMQTPAPVLLVPVEAPLPAAPYRRVVVPLDGSRWAESVLPLAVRLAKASEAELLLVHVVPTPEMIEARPLEVEDKKLQQALIERNEDRRWSPNCSGRISGNCPARMATASSR
jgi:Universal stress protein family